MQNSDKADNNNDSIKRKFDTWSTQPASLETLPSLAEGGGSNQELEDFDKNSRVIHSDPEERQAKVKTRSRFSSAIRKLSRSTRKKEKPTPRTDATLPAASVSVEPVLSSDADDLADNQVKTKKKKKSLFGLKKSKVAPKKEAIDSLPPQTARVLEPLFQDTENEVVVTTERLSPTTEGKRKVQITIKSKKIEKVASTDKVSESPSSSSSLRPPQPASATPSTTPNSTPPQTRPTATSTKQSPNLDDEDKKKKLKAKVKTQASSQKSTSTSTTTTTTAAAQAGRKELKAEEKIVITHSSKDTPPRDKAPAKPSRLAAGTPPTTTSHSTCSTSTASGAIRKTATTTRAAIKLVTAAKAKKKSLPSEANKAVNSKPGKGSATAVVKPQTQVSSTADVIAATANIITPITPTTVAVDNANKESDLMLNPQRGHRFPRPTSTDSADKSHESLGNQATTKPPPTPTSISPTTTLPTVSSTSPTPTPSPTPSPPPPPLPTSPQPQTIEIQSGSSLPSANNASLLLAKPISQSSVLSSPSPSQPPPKNLQQPQQHQPLSSQDNLVSNLSPNQTDDRISLAESVLQHQAFSEASSDKDINDPTPTSTIPSVRFTLGNLVRPPLILAKQLAYEPSSQEPYSIEQHSDDDSDSADSDDSRRRRIRYIKSSEERTLYDEFNNLDVKRTHFRYQSGVSDLSLDSHNEDIHKLEDLNQMPAFGDLTMDQEMEPVRWKSVKLNLR